MSDFSIHLRIYRKCDLKYGKSPKNPLNFVWFKFNFNKKTRLFNFFKCRKTWNCLCFLVFYFSIRLEQEQRTDWTRVLDAVFLSVCAEIAIASSFIRLTNQMKYQNSALMCVYTCVPIAPQQIISEFQFNFDVPFHRIALELSRSKCTEWERTDVLALLLRLTERSRRPTNDLFLRSFSFGSFEPKIKLMNFISEWAKM